VVIAGGLGYLAPTWVGLLLCVPGVVLALWSVALQRRAAKRAGGADSEVAGKVALDEDAVLDRTLS